MSLENETLTPQEQSREQTGHTPGPWKVSNYRPSQIIPRDPKESPYELGDNKFRPVAHIEFTHDITRDSANARLIAAAPDLLEALVAADAAMNHMGDILNGMDALEEEDEKYFPAFGQVRAAIARATGKAVESSHDRSPTDEGKPKQSASGSLG